MPDFDSGTNLGLRWVPACARRTVAECEFEGEVLTVGKIRHTNDKTDCQGLDNFDCAPMPYVSSRETRRKQTARQQPSEESKHLHGDEDQSTGKEA